MGGNDDDELDPVQRADEAHRLSAYRTEWARDIESFRRLHGRAFLLMQRATPSVPAAGAGKGFRTLVQRAPSAAFQDLPPERYLVYPVRKTERSLIDRFYSVGHTRNNDIVVRDPSISKFHAFFQDADDGSFLVQDARSTNGTYVNGARVAKQGQGDPSAVKTGDRVRLGNVELVLLDAPAFHDLLQRYFGPGGRH